MIIARQVTCLHVVNAKLLGINKLIDHTIPVCWEGGLDWLLSSISKKLMNADYKTCWGTVILWDMRVFLRMMLYKAERQQKTA